jgi:hypothetical protein
MTLEGTLRRDAIVRLQGAGLQQLGSLIGRARQRHIGQGRVLNRRTGHQLPSVSLAAHHNNFDGWDATHQPWNSVNIGPKRDSSRRLSRGGA